ncbi:MAG: peptide ABC transporter ATP-binding protein [Candidatus Wallbacteria bacterium HGW-Wallbacteria-1]|jgi:oligopeptide/dipeptide ABC transporter ATP-binding protein|uniref:Peptide ABC transporter ATP-binding protein n=1 Tax=Candidatus Wallbacteria bacterium HGW-Wallbacteria-1 TaxID=2013854 RepID=A0A2N1PT49_9BACT|nr:MAG: peptide ABC transporter ATP-binding protein [Candidatus Wallbacteria bacterium HGW-Wallbacteria-1]
MTLSNDQFPLLQVTGLETSFSTERGQVRAVDNLSFSLFHGETLCIVGESGCGKTVTALSIMGLLGQDHGKITKGSIKLLDSELTTLSEKELCKIRGAQISMVFQEPHASLNPALTIGAHLVEAIRIHEKTSVTEARERGSRLLETVGITEPRTRMNQYPHELSGGMKQRIMIALALACNPKIIIADEPTTALDVTMQAGVLTLLSELQKKYSMSILLITHDLGVVSQIADRVLVMYASQAVEEAPVAELLNDPLHPYTQGLLRCVPRLDSRSPLKPIDGAPPSPGALPQGCPFHPRCPKVMPVCRTKRPELMSVNSHRKVRCWQHVANFSEDTP